MLKYALLGFLSYQPMSGYELERIIGQSTTHFWHATLPQIYGVLKKLDQEELLSSRIEIQEGRPDKRVYEITTLGQETLQRWLEQEQKEVDPMKAPFILKAFFMGSVEQDVAVKQLESMLQAHKAMLHKFTQETPQAIQETASKFVLELEQPEQHIFYWDATRQLGIRYEEMYISWLEETLEKIKATI